MQAKTGSCKRLALNEKTCGAVNSKVPRKVAHLSSTFFAGSETFIYHYVTHHERFKPICLAYEFTNQEQFAFPSQDMLSACPDRNTPAWALMRVIRKCFRKDPYLTRQIRKCEIDILHAHFGPVGCIALSSKKSLDLPLVTTFYGIDIFGNEFLTRYRKRYEKLFRDGNLFLAEGPNMRDRLIEIGCPSERVEIQRIAIPLREIGFRFRKPKENGERVRLLFAGRFVEKKGLLYALEALRRVAKETRDFEFRIVGDGPLRNSIEEYLKDAGLEELVALLGFLPYKEHLAEMEKADLFLHPSVTADNGDSEGGAPTVILESQAHGMPVISTYHADIPNIVRPNKSALLSNERDVVSLADNILYLLENQDVWANMGLEGRHFVEQYHDIEKEVILLEEKYERLLR